MATFGGEDLIKKYGSRLKVAEALLFDLLADYEQDFVPEVVKPVFIKAAKARIELRLVKKEDLEKSVAE